MSIFSTEFAVFMVILAVLYFLVPKKLQWVILLAASIAFYLSGGWKGFCYILVTIISQYFLALALENKNDELARELGGVKSRMESRERGLKRSMLPVKKDMCLSL